VRCGTRGADKQPLSPRELALLAGAVVEPQLALAAGELLKA
jgi:hypothetical protein